MNIITLERQETLTVTMTMTLTFSVWKSVDSGPVPNRRSIKPSGIINTFFPLRVQNRVPGILFLGWTPFWLAANQEYPQVVYFWSQPQLYQDTSTLHPDTVCNKTDQLIDKVKHSHWIIQLKIQKLSQLCRYPTKAITQLIVMRSAYILPGSPTIICWEHE